MKLSNLTFGSNIFDEDLIETNTDAMIVVKGQRCVDRAISELGNITIGLYVDKWGRMTVKTPTLTDARNKYNQEKMIACNRWGCE